MKSLFGHREEQKCCHHENRVVKSYENVNLATAGHTWQHLSVPGHNLSPSGHT